MNEFEKKQARTQSFVVEHQVDALLLNKASSFAWATCGASSYINTASTDGLASLLITKTGRYLITTNIEAARLVGEEKLVDQGWELCDHPWHGNSSAVADLTGNLRLAADGAVAGALDLSAEISRVRSVLLPEEIVRFRNLGQLCAEAMDEAIRQVKPGQTEFEIASLLSAASEKRGVQAIVNLIATDERIYAYRHPLPTAKKMDRYAMLVLCGRKWGLVCSITRLVHYSALPEELQRKQQAVAEIDATFLAVTRPGIVLNQVFARALDAYAKTGYADEWRLHHQGGPAGYEPREFIVTPATEDLVMVNQAYAWNPSITGTKSEDTILIGKSENEVICTIPGWPMLSVMVDGKQYQRPAILEVK